MLMRPAYCPLTLLPLPRLSPPCLKCVLYLFGLPHEPRADRRGLLNPCGQLQGEGKWPGRPRESEETSGWGAG